MTDTTSALANLIKADWDDIHHSRNQDWKFWVVLTGIGAAAAALAGKPEGQAALPYLLLTGSVVSGIGGLVSWSHWELLCKKTARIEWLENWLGRLLGPEAKVGLPYHGAFRRKFPDRWSVSGIIFSVYVMMAVGFLVGLFLIVIDPPLPPLFNAGLLLLTSVLSFASVYCPFKIRMSKKREEYASYLCGSSDSGNVLVAEAEALEHAARVLQRHLVKLVVPASRGNETVWTERDWAMTEDKRLPVLLVESNFFEFSFATPEAEQSWHSHCAVYEIYTSKCTFTIFWRSRDGAEQTANVTGCAIIPPGIEHCVALAGPTFVFQATADGITPVAASKRT